MSSTALVPTLVHAGRRTRASAILRDLALVGIGMVLISLAAQVVIPLPFTPVPVTGQTFAALLIGGAYGLERGVATFGLYVLTGALGAPVFAGGAAGTAVLTSATGGYLAGMLVAAAVTGAAADLGWDRRLLSSFVAMIIGSAVIYLVGATWLAQYLDISASSAVELGVTPFIIGDLAKIVLAGALLPATWTALSRLGVGRDAS